MNKDPIHIKDPLVRQYFQQYRQQFPKLDQQYILRFATRKATWERDPNKLVASTVRSLIISLKCPPIILSLFEEAEQVKTSFLYNSFRRPTNFFLLNN